MEKIEFRGKNIGGSTTFEIWRKNKEIGLIWYASNINKWVLSIHGRKNSKFNSSNEAREHARKLLNS